MHLLPPVTNSNIKITLQTLEKHLLNHHKISENHLQSSLADMHHHQPTDLHVISPFYPRHQTKEICPCLYHRMKRLQFVQSHKPSPKRNKPTITISVHQSTDRHEPWENEQSRDRTMNKIHKVSRVTTKTFLDINETNQNTLHTNKLHEDQIINRPFLKLLKERLMNKQYKTQYMKLLKSFLRDNTKNTARIILENNLDLILNHLTIEELLKSNQLDAKKVAKMVKLLNCRPEEIHGILKNLVDAVHKVEKYLMNNANVDYSATINDTNVIGNNEDPNYSNNQNSMSESELQKKHLSNLFTVTNETEGEDWSLQGQTNPNNPLSKNEEELARESGMTYHSRCSKQSDKTRKTYHNKENNLNEDINNNELKGILNNANRTSQGKENPLTSIIKKQRKQRNGEIKNKKVRISSETIPVEFKLISELLDCSKETFNNVFKELKSSEKTDEEKIMLLFSELNIAKIIENSEKMEQLIELLSSVLDANGKELLAKLISKHHNRKYIEKLQEELDEMLSTVKQNMKDRKAGQAEEEEDESEELDMRKSMHQKQLDNRIQEFHEEKKKKIRGSIKHMIIKEELIVRKDVQSNELKQRELMGFRFSNVDRSLLRKPKCANEYNEQVSLRTTASNFECSNGSILPHLSPLPSSQNLSPVLGNLVNHRKLLKYMKKHHQRTFDTLVHDFKYLSKSLHHSDEPSCQL